jgi:hypothetical protein
MVCNCLRPAIEKLMTHHLRNAIMIRMIRIKSKFIVQPQPDQHGHCHPKSKSANIDKGVAFVLQEISPPDFYITFIHTVVV